MLFKDIDGKYIIINKLDFKTDKEYYKKILETKGLNIYNLEDPVSNILNIIEKKDLYMTYKTSKHNIA